VVRFLALVCIRTLPRGYAKVARLLASWLPSLRDVPLELELPAGATIRADLRESVFIPLARYGCYPHQLAEDRTVYRLIKPRDTVWDVGANIGYTALIYEAAAGPEGRVLAFEPSPRAYGFLQRTVGQRPCIEAFELALGNYEGEVTFREESFLDTSSLVEGEPTDGDVVVRAARIDDLVFRDSYPAPDFLKVDVEGHEAAVFEGARQLISRISPLIEFEALTRPLRDHVIALLDEASDGTQGYRYYGFEQQTGRLLPVAELKHGTSTNNYLALTRAHEEALRSKLLA